MPLGRLSRSPILTLTLDLALALLTAEHCRGPEAVEGMGQWGGGEQCGRGALTPAPDRNREAEPIP